MENPNVNEVRIRHPDSMHKYCSDPPPAARRGHSLHRIKHGPPKNEFIQEFVHDSNKEQTLPKSISIKNVSDMIKRPTAGNSGYEYPAPVLKDALGRGSHDTPKGHKKNLSSCRTLLLNSSEHITCQQPQIRGNVSGDLCKDSALLHGNSLLETKIDTEGERLPQIALQKTVPGVSQQVPSSAGPLPAKISPDGRSKRLSESA